MSNTTNTTPAITQQWGRGTLTLIHTHHLSHCVRRLDKSTIPHQEVVQQESSDHIHHDTITGRGASKKSRDDTVAEDIEMVEYSMLYPVETNPEMRIWEQTCVLKLVLKLERRRGRQSQVMISP